VENDEGIDCVGLAAEVNLHYGGQLLFRILSLITRNNTSFLRTLSSIDAPLSSFPFLRFQLTCSLYGLEKVKRQIYLQKLRLQVKEGSFDDEMCDSFGHHTPHLSVYDNAMVLHGQQIPLSLFCTSKILSRNMSQEFSF
jgi:hypothetical protein